jgi:hypothetical protein
MLQNDTNVYHFATIQNDSPESQNCILGEVSSKKHLKRGNFRKFFRFPKIFSFQRTFGTLHAT